MSISNKDSEFMCDVAEYFENTISLEHPNGSIRKTAKHFSLARTKVRKILVTKGVLKSDATELFLSMRSLGMSIEEIAEEMCLSRSTVSTYLPYGATIRNSLDPSTHALEVRGYRIYRKNRILNLDKRE